VLVYHERYDEWAPGAHVGTFRGHQLGMAAGRAALTHIVDNDLAGHAARVGSQLMAHLQDTATDRPELADVRGRGLLLGVEIVNADESAAENGVYPPDADLAIAIQRDCFDRGLVVERGGRAGATIRFLPPLVITDSEVDEVGELFDASVRRSQRNARRAVRIHRVGGRHRRIEEDL
jgi:diaminobutyrate-2-oxoglutarate transaminase